MCLPIFVYQNKYFSPIFEVEIGVTAFSIVIILNHDAKWIFENTTKKKIIKTIVFLKANNILLYFTLRKIINIFCKKNIEYINT